MRILKAQDMGMCFGVRDALAKTQTISDPVQVTVFGQLVHNPLVGHALVERGFGLMEETQRQQLPTTGRVLITAHGISEQMRQKLVAAGKELIDTTCPLVKKAHHAAQQLAARGCHVLVIGTPGHVEVNGIVEDLQSFAVVAGPEAVKTYPFDRLGIICQTTTPTTLAQAVRKKVAELNPHVQITSLDTICQPTKDRQTALENLLDQVQAMVVVGGHNYNNTRRLVDRCRQRQVPAYHVQCAGELEARRFAGVETVGLTAGTSTLPETIDAVCRMLAALTPPVSRLGVGRGARRATRGSRRAPARSHRRSSERLQGAAAVVVKK